jgi:hypothetical protein
MCVCVFESIMRMFIVCQRTSDVYTFISGIIIKIAQGCPDVTDRDLQSICYGLERKEKYYKFTFHTNRKLVNICKFATVLIKYYATRTYEEVEVKRHPYLTSGLDGSEWSASLPDRFISGQ